MRLSVNSILSVFRFINYLLARREAYVAKKHDETNSTISALIVKREKFHDERGRAAAAQRKMQELINF